MVTSMPDEREDLKLQYDWHKHLTTLSAGSLILTATLFGSVFNTFEAWWIAAISLSFFLFSALASAGGMFAIVVMTIVHQRGSKSELEDQRYWMLIISWTLFCGGIGMFFSFILANVPNLINPS